MALLSRAPHRPPVRSSVDARCELMRHAGGRDRPSARRRCGRLHLPDRQLEVLQRLREYGTRGPHQRCGGRIVVPGAGAFRIEGWRSGLTMGISDYALFG